MPITQARMAALLISAENCRDSAIRLRRLIVDAITRGTTIEALMVLAQHEAPSPEVLTVIAGERAHYNATHARNASEARRLARRRAETGGPSHPPPYAPRSASLPMSPRPPHQREHPDPTLFDEPTNDDVLAGVLASVGEPADGAVAQHPDLVPMSDEAYEALKRDAEAARRRAQGHHEWGADGLA